MARFDVYANPEKSEHRHTPYVLDVQNDHLNGVDTRIVIPMRDARVHGLQIERVQPEFTVRGLRVVLDTPTMATFPNAWLRTPVHSLREQSGTVQEALDAIFGAY